MESQEQAIAILGEILGLSLKGMGAEMSGTGIHRQTHWFFELEGGAVVRVSAYQLVNPYQFQKAFLCKAGVWPERVHLWEDVIRLVLDVTRLAIGEQRAA
jgi:hypothetical protein